MHRRPPALDDLGDEIWCALPGRRAPNERSLALFPKGSMRERPDLDALLQQARLGDSEALGQLMETCRGYLRTLAERQLGQRVAQRADASDVVQQAFLEAYQGFGQFAGGGGREMMAWLERILDHTVARTIRDHALLQKRSVRREQSLDDSRGQGTPQAAELPAGHSTPSQRAMGDEEMKQLLSALAELPEDQGRAVRLRYLAGLSLEQIAQQLGRSETAAAGLLKRGMQALRKQLQNAE